jgi:hypothetical protein
MIDATILRNMVIMEAQILIEKEKEKEWRRKYEQVRNFTRWEHKSK